MKATTLLERQHRNLQQLCEAVERGSARIRESLLPQLAGDLMAHIAIEEQLFYPAVCAALHEQSWSRSTHARHVQARTYLDRVLEAPADSEAFGRAMTELREIVDRHAEEEEEILFPQLERALDNEKMRELALEMMALYDTKVEVGYSPDSGSVPRGSETALRQVP